MRQKAAPPFYKHQVKDIQFCLDNERVLDTSDPGCGKTRVQVEAIRLRRKKRNSKTLILCPKSLLRSAWENDFRKFAREIRTSVAPASKREAAFAAEADVYITNLDAVTWLATKPPRFFKDFDTLVIDEITAFKHHTSQRSRAAAKIKNHFKHRAGLTGTPNSNSIVDMWHPVFLLDDGKRLGKSFYQFRNSVCAPKQVGREPNMVKWEDKPGAEVAVAGLLKDMVIRNVFEECHDIPKNVQHSVPFFMTPKQTKSYLQMEKSAITLVNNKDIVSAVNAAVVANKLLQIASGAVYSDGEAEYTNIDTDRYELVADLITAREHPCVVFFLWKHQRDGLIEEFKRRKLTYALVDGSTTDTAREEAVRHFQAGFYDVFLAHPASAAHGLTLTKATTTIWTSPTYNLEHFIQGNRRIYRAGQTLKTETIVILAKDTIEERVYNDILQSKNTRQTNMLGLLVSMSNKEPGNA